jgi:hypothetical protein
VPLFRAGPPGLPLISLTVRAGSLCGISWTQKYGIFLRNTCGNVWYVKSHRQRCITHHRDFVLLRLIIGRRDVGSASPSLHRRYVICGVLLGLTLVRSLVIYAWSHKSYLGRGRQSRLSADIHGRTRRTFENFQSLRDRMTTAGTRSSTRSGSSMASV